MIQVLHEGGIFAWLALVLGVLVVLCTLVGFIVGLASRSRNVRLVFALIGLFGLAALWGLGYAGHAHGIRLVQQALGFADADELLPLLFKGQQEVTWPMQVALWSSLLPAFFSSILLVVGLGTPHSSPAPSEGPDAKTWAAGLCAALGAGLCLLAAAAYFLFDGFYLPLMMLG
ncbi:MAG: hypothetical protein JXR96_26870 [Deltaproteobacteria bacterium]|nr:hypothetical protein [Deltaproteobacteria bacterium]